MTVWVFALDDTVILFMNVCQTSCAKEWGLIDDTSRALFVDLACTVAARGGGALRQNWVDPH